MTRRALLIGAQTYALSGVLHDVAAMGTALDKRGFTDIRTCAGPDATRDGIVAAYERLIAGTGPGDAVTVYYSGHGGYVYPLPGEVAEVAAINRQFVVPADYHLSDGDDFRGITAVELSVLLGRLTGRTGNVVVILDCCHAAMMSRDIGAARIRQIGAPALHDLEAHVRRRIGAGLRIDLSRPLGNADAVRLVACAADESAYEVPRPDGSGNHGLLTDALIRAMDEADGTRITWSALMRRVRHLVRLRRPHQRPEAEGPSGRMLFDTAPGDSAEALPVLAAADGLVRLPGAPLLGVQAGDEFLIMPSTAERPAPDGSIGTVRIDRCVPAAAEGVLRPARPGATVPPGARAFRTRATAPRIPVRVPDRLVPAVEAGTFTRAAGPGEPAPLTVAVAADGALTVHDATGPLHAPRPPGPETDARVVADLTRVARATVLREIRETSGWTADAPVALEWGLVRDGEAYRLPPAGAAVGAGDHVYLKVRNDDRAPLYLSLVDVGVSYRITVLTAFAPSGVRLDPGAAYVFGWDDRHRRLTGVPVTWPYGLDGRHPRPETVLALLTPEPHDMTTLEQSGVRDGDPSPLGAVLAHLGAGATREFGPAPGQGDRYAVRSFEFDLVPAA